MNKKIKLTLVMDKQTLSHFEEALSNYVDSCSGDLSAELVQIAFKVDSVLTDLLYNNDDLPETHQAEIAPFSEEFDSED